MYYIPFGTCRFASYDVDSQKTTILKDFKSEYPECTTIRNDTEGTSSVGSRYWAWMVQGAPALGTPACWPLLFTTWRRMRQWGCWMKLSS
ncbi:MAG: hypothetical protein IPP47_20385 [Bryobacterales bacterium]|nr:hypothetical protein [Bryobacterales bacterium]